MNKLAIPRSEIEQFCRKWRLSEFALFGSAIRDDLRPESDVDVLVSFAPGGEMTFEGFLEMRDELSRMCEGRPIDLVEKRLLRNPFRRHRILATRQGLYAA